MEEKFTWGRVVKDHHIGPYMIREYHPRKVKDVELTREIDESKVCFHGYIDGKSVGETWESLEDAMVGLIVRRVVGLNHSKIGYHFMAGLRGIAY